MKLLLSCLCVLLLATAWKPFFSTQTTKIYYVSISGGNDANTGLTSSLPLKTLSKVDALMNAGTIATGDSVLLKAGDAWLLDSLTLFKGININSYGTGAQPVISGFYTVTSWTNLGSGIYESEAMPTPAVVNMVAINGKPYAMGRYPNADASNGGYLTYEASASGSISDNSGKPAAVDNTWANATVVARQSNFVIERSTITVVSGNTISFSPAFSSSSNGGNGYFLENSTNALDQLGEWYYNPTSRKIDVYFPSGPSGFTVQVAAKNNLCEPRASNTSISNITFQGGNQYCLYNNFGGVSGLIINNCNFKFAGSSLVGLAGRSGLVISNSYFQYANNNAISITYHNDRPKILNCTIRDWGLFPGMYYIDNNISARYGFAICSLSQSWESPAYYGATILNTKILNGGYTGIFAEGDSTIVKYNYVDTTCTVMQDGGGIYTGNSAAAINKYGVFDSNQIFHALGNKFGTTYSALQGEGLYLDDNTINVEVKGNTVAHNSHYGIFLHNARKNNIQNNVVIDNGAFQFAAQDDHIGAFAVDSNNFQHNPLFAMQGQKLMYLAKETDVSTPFSHFFSSLDNNQYCEPFRRKVSGIEDSIIETNWFSHSQVIDYNLGSWKTFCNAQTESIGYDAHTTITPIIITDPTHVIFRFNTSAVVSKRLSFCTPLVGVDNTGYSKLATVNPIQSLILLQP